MVSAIEHNESLNYLSRNPLQGNSLVHTTVFPLHHCCFVDSGVLWHHKAHGNKTGGLPLMVMMIAGLGSPEALACSNEGFEGEDSIELYRTRDASLASFTVKGNLIF